MKSDIEVRDTAEGSLHFPSSSPASFLDLSFAARSRSSLHPITFSRDGRNPSASRLGVQPRSIADLSWIESAIALISQRFIKFQQF